MDLKEKINVYEGFPKEGISFKDINSLIIDPQAFEQTLSELQERMEPLGANKIASPESRGYIIGAPLANRMGLGFVPIRKPGKLPGEVVSRTYELEYGEDTLEMQKDSISPGDRVILVDDLLATGGTLKAAAEIIESLGGEVAGVETLIELTDLKGRDRLGKYPVESLVEYPV